MGQSRHPRPHIGVKDRRLLFLDRVPVRTTAITAGRGSAIDAEQIRRRRGKSNLVRAAVLRHSTPVWLRDSISAAAARYTFGRRMAPVSGVREAIATRSRPMPESSSRI